MKRKSRRNVINDFLKISLNSADLVETFDITNEFTDGLGLGIRSYPSCIRDGVLEVIKLRQENTNLKDSLEYTAEELKEFQELIPIDDLDFFSDEQKERIRKFCEKIIREVEE